MLTDRHTSGWRLLQVNKRHNRTGTNTRIICWLAPFVSHFDVAQNDDVYPWCVESKEAPVTDIHGSPPIRLVKPWKDMFPVFYHPHLWSTKSRTEWTAAKTLANWVSRICWSSFFTWNHGKYCRFTFWKTCRSTKFQKMTRLRTDAQRLLFYICKSHPRMRRLIYWQQETSCCHD